MSCQPNTCKKKCCPWMFVIIALVLAIVPAIFQANSTGGFNGPFLTDTLYIVFATLQNMLPILALFALIKYVVCKKNMGCPYATSGCCAPGGACNTEKDCKKEGPCA